MKSLNFYHRHMFPDCRASPPFYQMFSIEVGCDLSTLQVCYQIKSTCALHIYIPYMGLNAQRL